MRYGEEILPCGGGEALAQGAQRGCGSLEVSKAGLDGAWSKLG